MINLWKLFLIILHWRKQLLFLKDEINVVFKKKKLPMEEGGRNANKNFIHLESFELK